VKASAKRDELRASALGTAACLFATLVAPVLAADGNSFQPNQSFKDCEVCPEMVAVPSGAFTMGSPNNEAQRKDNEGPQHEVRFARPFAVGKFAVTFDEWDACVAERGCNGYRPWDRRWGGGRQPVIFVSWNDAKAYVTWLSRKTGKAYRLPSEAEREYVTRAGTTTPFWWGTSISTQQANYYGVETYGNGSKGEYRHSTMPVDAFAANPWGLHQVHGNVWEYTEDCWNDSYLGAPTDGRAWTSGNCLTHALRGGSFVDEPASLRSARRIGGGGNDVRSTESAGFRVVRPIDAR
jgi:formylglycine-generating enzyme required for sulfatase activity